jgi:hypothetical protein
MRAPGACVLGFALMMASATVGADSQPPECLRAAEFVQKGLASGAIVELDPPVGPFRYKFIDGSSPRIAYVWLGQKDDGTAIASFQPPGQEPSHHIPFSTLGVVWGDHFIVERSGAIRLWVLLLLVHDGRETAVAVEVLEFPDGSRRRARLGRRSPIRISPTCGKSFASGGRARVPLQWVSSIWASSHTRSATFRRRATFLP